jgi:lysophospholipase L1-like esterase
MDIIRNFYIIISLIVLLLWIYYILGEMYEMRVKLVCIGDSLTEGYGIRQAYRWSNLLNKDLNMEIINSGISGDTTSGMLARFHNMVIVHNPTHVIITGGTNDLWFNLSDEQIISNILAMTRYARYNGIISIIGIPTPYYYDKQVCPNSTFLDAKTHSERIEGYRKKLISFALEDGLNIIDFSLNMTCDLFLEDGLHPNERGHEIMKENAENVLLQILK